MSTPLFILYGSATGNSQTIAQDLAAAYKNTLPLPFTEIICCQGNDFKRKCAPIWEKEPAAGAGTKYGLVIVTATTGDGDSPENASRFIRYLKRKTTPDTKPFRHVAFGVLGLGDTNYNEFCQTAKVADSCLLKCGGTRSKPLGCADEGTGLEEVVESWVADIVPILGKACSGTLKDADQEAGINLTHEEKKDDGEGIVNPVSHGSRPNIPNMLGSRPNIPNMPTTRPDTLNSIAPSFGSRPNIAAIQARSAKPQASASIIGSRPDVQRKTIPSVAIIPSDAVIVKNEDIVDVTTLSSPSPLCILYGSATGNAEQIAKDLATKCKQIISESSASYFPKVICCELDKYKKECASHWEDDSSLNCDLGQKHGVIIVSSTTGNGEAPENASRFVRYVKRKSTATTMPFRHCAFSVLGLGDTNYDQFCNTAIVIDKKIHDLGGVRVKNVACADEGTGLEAVVDPWVETIFDLLIKRCRGDGSTLSKNTVKPESDTGALVDNRPDDEIVTHVTEPVNASVPQPVENSILASNDCLGVSLIRKLLSSLPSKEDSSIPIVEDNSVPRISSVLSSYQVVDENKELEQSQSRESNTHVPLDQMETMTISTTSSSGINYTVVCPFDSAIVSARYLTNTATKCAQVVSETFNARQLTGDDSTEDDILIEAAKKLQNAFPLDNEEGKADDDGVYSKNGKRVIELTLSLPDDYSLEYKPGDSIGLVASNTPAAIKFVLDMLNAKHGILPAMKITVDSGEPTSVKQVVSDRLDLCSTIKSKRILACLSKVATDKHEASTLRLLASKEPIGEDMFRKYIDEQRRNVIDILLEFPSCQCVTLSDLLAVIPSITPRYYSICSSPLEKMESGAPMLNVVFSVVDYLTSPILADVRKRRVGGLVTSHLETICSPFLCQSHAKKSSAPMFSPRVRIFPKPSCDFHLPSQLTKPLILIGPGTGIAPFMGFLAHRKAEILALDASLAAKVASEGTWRGDYTFDKNDLSVSTYDASGLSIGNDYRNSQKVGEVDVYFGCRHSDHDWLFKDEMECLLKEGVISKLNTSFSRDGTKKAYVQDKMKSNADRVARMVMDDDAVVFICGDGNKMARDVQNTLVDIFARRMSETSSDDCSTVQLEAKQYLEQMKLDKRFVLDIWS